MIERVATRDHTELMLRAFGAKLEVETLPGGGRSITLAGKADLTGRAMLVPADPSSAAFPMAAALLVPGSEITLAGVGLNPLRTGLIDTLREMGADITLANARIEAGEPVAELIVRHGPLKGVDVPAERAPSMIDEYPVLSVVAACASGTTRMRGLGELRVKESDRLAAMATGLAACGATVSVEGDDLIVTGTGRPPPGGAEIAVHLDHRIGMSFLVLGMVTKEPVTVDDGSTIDTSFPGLRRADEPPRRQDRPTQLMIIAIARRLGRQNQRTPIPPPSKWLARLINHQDTKTPRRSPRPDAARRMARKNPPWRLGALVPWWFDLFPQFGQGGFEFRSRLRATQLQFPVLRKPSIAVPRDNRS